MREEVYPEWYVDVKNISPNRVTENFLDFMGLRLEDLKDKSITSIGWWFWIFEMDMAKEWSNVIIVDPMFANVGWIDWKLQKNIDWIWSKMKWNFETRLEWRKKELIDVILRSNDEAEVSEAEKTLQWCNDRQSDMKEYMRRRKILLNHLNNWKENQIKYWLVLNPSSWDNIKWIEKNTQDIVIIGHTLWHIYNKSFWDIREFLKEALKLLKSWWKLYIIDYVWYINELERTLEKTDKKIYYKVNKWSFVCCFDKKWLDEFLENELK